jgi:predicted phosphodiesterase
MTNQLIPFALIPDAEAEVPEGAELVLLAGDTHGNPTALRDIFYDAVTMGAKTIIQCGDFGFGWSMDKDDICQFSLLASLLSEEYDIDFYWLDGNHENYDKLEVLPIDPVTGLRPILSRVTHLPRGSTLKIGNTTFRAFGGAHSVDKYHRTMGISWWPQELITDDDVEKALSAGPADIFLSHDAPLGVQNVENLTAKLTHWGREATEKSLANQERVREALDASGATVAFHGHLHQSYERVLDTGTRVIGLNRDEEHNNTYIVAC